MLISDLFQETSSALLSNKARSGLTILGVVIGIGSVIAMIAIGQGAQGTIQSNIQSLGSNLIEVMPGMQRGFGYQVSQGRGSAQTLTSEDADAISNQVSLINGVAPELSGRYQVTAKGTNTNTSVLGVTSSYPAIRNVQIDQGSFVSDQNVASMSKVAVLGPTVRDDLFGTDVNPVGETIRIRQIEFKVIGLTLSKGGSSFGSQDAVSYTHLTLPTIYSV